MRKFPRMSVTDTLNGFFQSCVQSGLLYGSEISGQTNISSIDTIQCSFVKRLLGVRKRTSNVGALSEVGLLTYRRYIDYLKILDSYKNMVYESYQQLLTLFTQTMAKLHQKRVVQSRFIIRLAKSERRKPAVVSESGEESNT